MPYAIRLLAGIVALALPFGSVGCGSGSSSGGGGGGPETLVNQNVCQTCHSPTNSVKDLSGSTKNLKDSYGLAAYGRNLTPDKDTGLGNWTDQEIKDAILHGRRNDGTMLCSVMPLYGTPCDSSQQSCSGPLTDAEADEIVGYLKGLDPVKHDIPTSPCN